MVLRPRLQLLWIFETKTAITKTVILLFTTAVQNKNPSSLLTCHSYLIVSNTYCLTLIICSIIKCWTNRAECFIRALKQSEFKTLCNPLIPPEGTVPCCFIKMIFGIKFSFIVWRKFRYFNHSLAICKCELLWQWQCKMVLRKGFCMSILEPISCVSCTWLCYCKEIDGHLGDHGNRAKAGDVVLLWRAV